MIPLVEGLRAIDNTGDYICPMCARAAARIDALEAALRKIKCPIPTKCVVDKYPNAYEYFDPCCIARRALEGKH